MPHAVRRLVAISLCAFTLMSSGCMTVRPYESVGAALLRSNGPIRITKSDNTRLTLSSPVIRGDSVAGFSIEPRGRYFRHVALADVTAVEARQENSKVIAGIAVVGGGLLALLIYFSRDYCTVNCN